MADKDRSNEKGNEYHGSETILSWKPRSLDSSSDSLLISKFLFSVPVTSA